MHLEPQQIDELRYLIRCLDEFQPSELHDNMVERSVVKECEIIGITEREQKLAIYKEKLVESRLKLHNIKTILYAMAGDIGLPDEAATAFNSRLSH